MEGDITRSFRLNPRTQLAITEYKKKHDSLNRGKAFTLNKILNCMLQDVGSEEWLKHSEVLAHRDALKKRVAFLRRHIYENVHPIWTHQLSSKIKAEYDNDFEVYLFEVWGY